MNTRTLHPWNVTPKEAVQIQLKLQSYLREEELPLPVRTIAGADAAFSKEKKLAYGAVAVYSLPELKLLESKTAVLPLTFPYVPGLLAFREGPVLLECVRKLETEPDLILFDGQGIAHPRGMGIAAHLGILLNKPAIGCAKSRLFGRCAEPGPLKGDYSDLLDDDGHLIGACLRSRDNVRPVYVSAGYRITLAKAIQIVLQCSTRYRVPEPLREADRLAEKAKKNSPGIMLY